MPCDARGWLTVVVLCAVAALAAAGCYCPATSSNCRVQQSAQTTAPSADEEAYAARRDEVIEWLKARNGYNDHVRKVVRYAELLNEEYGAPADPQVVEVAALLHDCGYQIGKGPKKKVRDLHAELGAAAARGLLPNTGFSAEFTDHVSHIVAAHHSVTKMDTPEWRAVWMADLAVNRNIEVTDQAAGQALDELQKRLENRRDGQQSQG